MPMEDNLLRRMVWEIVSKAALRSRRMRMDSKPGRSFVSLSLCRDVCCEAFHSQVFQLKVMSSLHWPASGAFWDLQFLKQSQVS